jgi:hypothetical protein
MKGQRLGVPDRSLMLSRLLSIQPPWCKQYAGLDPQQRAALWATDVAKFQAMTAQNARKTAINEWQVSILASQSGFYASVDIRPESSSHCTAKEHDAG